VKNPEGALEPVRPQDIRSTSLLTIEGELDDISGSGQTQAAHGLCTGIAPAEKRHLEIEGAGHYGIFSGRRWREQVYPIVRDFIAGRDKPQMRPMSQVLAQEDEVAAAPTAKKRAAPAPVRKTRAKSA
jgi:poly(3-hydroxybutyrate) depolymerase